MTWMLPLVSFLVWKRRAGRGSPSTPYFEAPGSSWVNQARFVKLYSSLFQSEYKATEGQPTASGIRGDQLQPPAPPDSAGAACWSWKAPSIQCRVLQGLLGHPPDLLDVINKSSPTSGSLPVSCQRDIIALLPKKGNPQDNNLWMPTPNTNTLFHQWGQKWPQFWPDKGWGCEPVSPWRQNICARIRLEFCFYRETKNLEAVKQRWGVWLTKRS